MRDSNWEELDARKDVFQFGSNGPYGRRPSKSSRYDNNLLFLTTSISITSRPRGPPPSVCKFPLFGTRALSTCCERREHAKICHRLLPGTPALDPVTHIPIPFSSSFSANSFRRANPQTPRLQLAITVSCPRPNCIRMKLNPHCLEVSVDPGRNVVTCP
jgi:hypothetical protein